MPETKMLIFHAVSCLGRSSTFRIPESRSENRKVLVNVSRLNVAQLLVQGDIFQHQVVAGTDPGTDQNEV